MVKVLLVLLAIAAGVVIVCSIPAAIYAAGVAIYHVGQQQAAEEKRRELENKRREEEDALINGVELALDWGLDIPPEHVAQYHEIIRQRSKESEEL